LARAHGRRTAALKNHEAVTFVENQIFESIKAETAELGHEIRFIPYLSQHEYEALLFSDPAALAGVTQGVNHERQFRAVLVECGECEKINDNDATAPSRRIQKIATGYQKTVDGITAAERIGIETMREKCPHFDAWLKRLEGFGSNIEHRTSK
jgi:uncharacterized protein DUF4276